MSFLIGQWDTKEEAKRWLDKHFVPRIRKSYRVVKVTKYRIKYVK